jgi:hypothetical protein
MYFIHSEKGEVGGKSGGGDEDGGGAPEND